MTQETPDSGPAVAAPVEQSAMIVAQPHKLESLLGKIEEITASTEIVSEDATGGSGGAQSATVQGDNAKQSPRDKAIANLPNPKRMQQHLESHIEGEIKKLRKEVKRVAWSVNRKGAAHKANELYAKIRRLHGILHELYETSVEVIRRLYIRIIIDKQPVL